MNALEGPGRSIMEERLKPLKGTLSIDWQPLRLASNLRAVLLGSRGPEHQATRALPQPGLTVHPARDHLVKLPPEKIAQQQHSKGRKEYFPNSLFQHPRHFA